MCPRPGGLSSARMVEDGETVTAEGSLIGDCWDAASTSREPLVGLVLSPRESGGGLMARVVVAERVGEEADEAAGSHGALLVSAATASRYRCERG